MAESILSKLLVKISADSAQFTQSLKQTENQFSSFSKNIKGFGASIGVSLGFVALIAATKEFIGIQAGFESTLSEVKAITGATGDEFQSLENDALRLGAATQFTAKEVGGLQVAYGRLGFTTKEILDATEATLQLATATGEDLAKSADVAGSTVRGFGLRAKETQRVVDVMASSFNKTALGLDNFTESMKYVAPIAAAAGASVEETTALLGVLADAGIRGSQAGTSLRKIFTDMTRDGRPLSERLAELGKKGITLADSFDEVGRTAQTSLLILANNTDKVANLTREFGNVAGEAERVSRIMRDNLTGDVDKLSSAFEGLILKIGGSDLFRDFVQSLTLAVSAISGANFQLDDALDAAAKIIKNNGDKIKAGTTGFDFLVNNLAAARKEAGKPIDTKAIEFFAEKYKLTDDQVNVLFQSIVKANKALSFQEAEIAKFKQFAADNGYDDLTRAAEAYKAGIYKSRIELQVFQEQAKKVGSVNAIASAQKDLEKFDRAIRIINDYISDIETKTKDNAAAATFETIDSLEAKVKELKAQIDASPTSDIPFLKELNKQVQSTQSRIEYLRMLIDGFQTTDLKYVAPTDVNKIIGEDDMRLDPYQDSRDIEKANDDAAASFENVRDAAYKFLATQEGFAGYGLAYIDMSEKIKKATVDFTPVIQSALSGIAQAFGQAVSGSEEVGNTLLRVLGGVLVQLGEMILASGLGVEAFKASLETLDGPVAIAAGIALIALGSAISSSISSLGSNPTGKGGGNAASSARNNITNWRDQIPEINLQGEFTVRGNDLVYVFNRQTQLNGRTRG
jgi:hypothetical protein